ncbi:MAG: ArnT family glycosyltransferase [Bacteroidota bacterium]
MNRYAAGLWLAMLAVVVVIAGIGVDLMEVDAAQYASMGQEMNETGQWVQLHEHGALYQSRGYPDKPPLVFWAAALGTKVLGATNAGAKIISVIVGLLGIWALGRWASELLGPSAFWPALTFYGANIGMGLMLQDVRTDTLLVALVSLAGWQSQVWKRTGAWMPAMLAFAFLGLAMLAKGPLAFMALTAALGGHALWNRDYRILRRASFWGGLGLMILILLPWLWGLYQQWGWDRGIRYYLWTQNFGRITGENPWAHRADYSFVLHNLLWSFLPWVVFLPSALIWALRNPSRNRELSSMSLTAWTLLVVGLSISKFQLPHYVYILWPFQALLITQWWIQAPPPRPLRTVPWKLMSLMGLLCCMGVDYAWFGVPLATLTGTLGLAISWALRGRNALWMGASALLLTLLVLNAIFYPKLLTYQASSRLGQWAVDQGIAPNLQRMGCDNESIHALHFYTHRVIPEWSAGSAIPGNSYTIYTSKACADSLRALGMEVEPLQEMPSIKVTRLSLSFLDPRTRNQQGTLTGIYRVVP